jgi:hypothetical protein
MVAVAAMVAAVRRAEAPYADTDILWGTRSGLDILGGHGLPRVDHYSWTAAGERWIPNSWGWNLVLGAAYRTAGYIGIAVVGVVAMGLVGALLGVAVRRAGGYVSWGLLATQISLGLFAVFFYPRAQLSDYAAVLAVPLLLARALDLADRRAAARAGVGLACLQVVWMNLHSTAVLGPVMIAVGGGALLAGTFSRARAVRLLTLTAVAALACLATPFWTSPITHLAEVRQASMGLIAEWRPAGFGSAEQVLAVAAILIGLGAVVVAWRRRAFDTVALLVLFSVMAGVALRFAPLVVLTAVPVIASAAGRVPARPEFVSKTAVLALAVLSVACIAGSGSFADPGAQNTSPTLVAALPHGCRLVNDIAVGGAVILLRPDVKVSIDSRNDMYGRQRELVALRVLGDPTFGSGYVDAHDVGCVLAPTSTPLVRTLRSSYGWRVAGRDAVRTLLVRTVPS